MLTLNHTPKHTELLFSNFTEFCHFTQAQADKTPRATGHDSNFEFRHTRNLPECMSLASTGWADGRKAILKIADKLNVSSRLKTPELYFDVTGDYGLDMGLFASGEPECAIAFRDSEIDNPNPSGSIVKLIINTVISCNVDKDIYMQRGAAIVALIDTLEAAGKRVEVNAVWSSMGYGDEQWTLNIPLKSAGEHVQIDQMAFVLAHPSFVRRMCFIAHGAINANALSSSQSYCGMPTDYKLGNPDVYMPRMHGSEPQWATLKACQDWTIAKLKELGIELEAQAKY